MGTRNYSLNESRSDIWIMELESGVRNQMTFGPWLNTSPVWSPDGKRIAYRSVRDGIACVYLKPADGSSGEELLFKPGTDVAPQDWSRDGRYLLCAVTNSENQVDIWAVPVNPNQGEKL
jgi:TolB protein